MSYPLYNLRQRVRIITGNRAGELGWIASYPMGNQDGQGYAYRVRFTDPDLDIWDPFKIGYREWELEEA